MQGVVTGNRLAKTLSVYADTPRNWRDHGLLQGKLVNNQLVFEYDEVNSFIVASTRNSSWSPTIQELLAKTMEVLTPREAAAMLGCTIADLQYARGTNNLAYLEFGGVVRFMRSVIEAEATRRRLRAEGLNSRDLERILCLSDVGVRQVIREGRLHVNREGRSGGRYTVDMASLLTLLSSLLPPYIRPQDWISDSLAATGQTIPVNKVGLPWVTVTARLKEFELPYIKTLKGHWRLPAETVRLVIANDMPALPEADIAFLFGVNPEKARRWIKTGALLCNRHLGHPEHCLRPACLRRYITTHSNTESRWWYARRMRDKEEVADLAELRGHNGITDPILVRGLVHRTLVGVRIPTNPDQRAEWRVLRRDAVEFYKRLRKVP